jgi:hypothetical protein
MKTLTARVTALVVLLALAACATGSKPAAQPSPTINRARDRDRAKAIVFTRYDFPKGWKMEPISKDHLSEKQSAQAEKEFKECAGVAAKDTPTVVDYTGRDFSFGPSSVGSSVSYVREEAQARADLSATRNGAFIRCLMKAFRAPLQAMVKELDKRVRVGKITVRRLAVPAIGDARLAFRITIPISGPAGSVKLYMDMVLVLAKRAEVTATFFSALKPFSAALEHRLLIRLGKRLALA